MNANTALTGDTNLSKYTQMSSGQQSLPTVTPVKYWLSLLGASLGPIISIAVFLSAPQVLMYIAAFLSIPFVTPAVIAVAIAATTVLTGLIGLSIGAVIDSCSGKQKSSESSDLLNSAAPNNESKEKGNNNGKQKKQLEELENMINTEIEKPIDNELNEQLTLLEKKKIKELKENAKNLTKVMELLLVESEDLEKNQRHPVEPLKKQLMEEMEEMEEMEKQMKALGAENKNVKDLDDLVDKAKKKIGELENLEKLIKIEIEKLKQLMLLKKKMMALEDTHMPALLPMLSNKNAGGDALQKQLEKLKNELKKALEELRKTLGKEEGKENGDAKEPNTSMGKAKGMIEKLEDLVTLAEVKNLLDESKKKLTQLDKATAVVSLEPLRETVKYLRQMMAEPSNENMKMQKIAKNLKKKLLEWNETLKNPGKTLGEKEEENKNKADKDTREPRELVNEVINNLEDLMNNLISISEEQWAQTDTLTKKKGNGFMESINGILTNFVWGDRSKFAAMAKADGRSSFRPQ